MNSLVKLCLLLLCITLIMGMGIFSSVTKKETFANPQVDTALNNNMNMANAGPMPYPQNSMAESNALEPIKHNTNVMPYPQSSNGGAKPMTPHDLMPLNNNGWQMSNPQTTGNLENRNFIETASHFGIDTIGSSLKNANHQIRSDPIVEQIPNITPWNNSTITPDLNRKHFEIGSA